MHARILATALLVSGCSLTAQFYTSLETQTRRTARAAWLGVSGEQSIALEFGPAAWRADYARFVDDRGFDRANLGNGATATLRSDVDLTIGGAKVARGRWYVGVRRDAKGDWALALFDADQIDAQKRGSSPILASTPDVVVPARTVRDADPVQAQLDITFAEDKRAPRSLTLTVAWGPYRLHADVVAAFDDRKPDGMRDFALTAEGKGKKTPTGLIYEQLRAGEGATPGPNDVVRVHYTGWLADGTQFDSSLVRGGPVSFPVSAVVKGFGEGLQLMQKGASARLTLPPDLAYGDRGAGQRVPPGATLVFVVELLDIERR